jgi:transmembrane sensor
LVRVLGTRFAVRHYPSERTSRIVVEEGRVALQPLVSSFGEKSIVLSAHTAAQVTDSGTSIIPGISAADYTGWTQGTLVFREIPLRDVVADLSRAYGADIRIADTALARQRVTMTAFIQRQSLSDVLGLLGIATNTHYTQSANVFVIMLGRSAGRAPQRTPVLQSEKAYGR